MENPKTGLVFILKRVGKADQAHGRLIAADRHSRFIVVVAKVGRLLVDVLSRWSGPVGFARLQDVWSQTILKMTESK
jgi:hypothetical protein